MTTRLLGNRATLIFSVFNLALILAAGAQRVHLSGSREAATGTFRVGANLGTVKVGSSGPTTTLLFTFDTAALLGSLAVVTQGATGLDFNDAGTGTCRPGITYSAGTTCTVDVTFTPKFAGVRYGATVFHDVLGNVLATGYMQGQGSGPQIDFTPGIETRINNVGSSWAVAVDGSGNIYAGGGSLDRILKETPTATGGYVESTVATGTNTELGLAVDGAGNVYVAEGYDGVLLKETLTGSGGYTQSVIGSGLGSPWGVAVDGSGNLYLPSGSFSGVAVWKETLVGDSYIQSAVPTSGLGATWGIAVDDAGNLYIADTFYGARIVKETVSGDGSYVQSTIVQGISRPAGLAIDGVGNLFIAQYYSSNQILKATLFGKSYVLSTVPTGPFDAPYGIAVDGGGNLYVADYGGALTKEDLEQTPKLAFREGETRQGSSGGNSPQTITIENNGNLDLIFPVPGSGLNPVLSGPFTLDSSGASACPVVTAGSSQPGTLAANQACLMPISFKPTEIGSYNGELKLTDNHLNAAAPDYLTQSIVLTGVDSWYSQTSLMVSGTRVAQGQPATITAAVHGISGIAVPTGEVVLSGLGQLAISIALNASGVAVYTSSTLGPGNYYPSAKYLGDRNYQPSESSGSFQVIGVPSEVWSIGRTQWSSQYPKKIIATLCAEVVNADGGNVVVLPGITVTFIGQGISFNPASGVSDVSGLVCTQASTTAAIGNMTATASVAGVKSTPQFGLSIAPAPLEVTVQGSWRLYGGLNPVFFNSFKGLVIGDTVSVTDQTTASPASPVGSYPVTATVSGDKAQDYVVTVIAGTLTVRRAILHISAKNQTVTYGQTPVQPTAYRLDGFVNGESAIVVAGSPVLSTFVTSTTPVGFYRTVVGAGTLAAANYSVSTISNGEGGVNVYKAPLTVHPDSFTIHRGDPLPRFTYSITGFVNSETQTSATTGAPLLATTARSTSVPGRYYIIFSRGTLTARNYYFTNLVPAGNGILTILN